jgi:hypothetical protein
MRGVPSGGAQRLRRTLRLSALTITTVCVLSSCTRTRYAPPDPEVLETTLPPDDQVKTAVQQYATLAMAAMGDAYRLAVESEDATEGALILLRDGFTGAALEGEEANLRDAIDVRNALARVPGDPQLSVNVVTDQTATCVVVQAEFDDRPFLAFPTASSGDPVIARFRETEGDSVWRIDVLVSPDQASLNPVRCPELSLAPISSTTPTVS